MSPTGRRRKLKVGQAQRRKSQAEQRFLDSIMESWHSDKKSGKYPLGVNLFVLRTLRELLRFKVHGRTHGGWIADEILLGVNGPIAAVARLGHPPPKSVANTPARIGRWAMKNRVNPILAGLLHIPRTPRTARNLAKCLEIKAASHSCIRGRKDHPLIESLKSIRGLRGYKPKLESPLIGMLPPKLGNRERLIEAAEEFILATHLTPLIVSYLTLVKAMGEEPGDFESGLINASDIRLRMVSCIDSGIRVRNLVQQFKLHREFRFQPSRWRCARKRVGKSKPLQKAKDQANFLLLDVLTSAGFHSRGKSKSKGVRMHEDIFFQAAAMGDRDLLKASASRQRSARDRLRTAYRRYVKETGW